MATSTASIKAPGSARNVMLTDIAMAAVVLLIVGMMIVPLPKQVLDLLIVTNLAGSLLVLLVTIYTKEPLRFAAFPSILLLATLFRLGLNVLSTRLILLHGDAGDVIHAFGTFVIGGSPVVGVVVFLILVVIQFVVITNGAGRVSEVAARFTLDAMPGKQMAIDADLNSGAIDDVQARTRRREVEQEASFYGAMDGASKFVKGDAIAGVIIILINIVGGFIIGMFQRGMAPDDALRSYTILTVGDGLVSQIPALLISTATGMLVTRVVSDGALGQDVADQLLVHPRALYVVSVVLGALALAPGLPMLPFLLLSAAAGGIGYALSVREKAVVEAEAKALPPAEPESLSGLLNVDPLELEVGFGLVPLVDGGEGTLLGRITMIRRQVATDLGVLMPVVRIHDNIDLPPNSYRFRLRTSTIAQGEVRPDRVMALDPGGVDEAVEGIGATEPAFGLPALWIPKSDRELAEIRGYTVVDPASVIVTHFTEVVKAYAHLILSRQDARNLLDNVKVEHPAVVDEVLNGPLSLSDVHRVLQNLLREGVSIRDLVSVLEALGTYAKVTTDPDVLTEFVRQSLGRTIVAQYVDEEGALHAMTLDAGLQEVMMSQLRATESRLSLDIDTATGQELIQAVAKTMESMASRGFSPVLMVPGPLRLALRRYLEALPRLAVMSYGEVPQGTSLRNEGVVTI